MVPLFIAILLSALPFSSSLSIPTIRSPLQKRSVFITFTHVDEPIQRSDPTRNRPGEWVLQRPRTEMQAAVDYATVIADSAWQALGRAGIENTPEFRLYFGRHNNPQVAIDTVRGTGHTFASTLDHEITIFRDMWRDFVPHYEVVPECVAEEINIAEGVDSVQSWASVILHELVHMVAIDAPNIYVLNERTNPTEVSDVSAVLDRAAYHPNDAIYNPESLTHYALAVHYNILARQPDNNNYPIIAAPVAVPDPFDQLANLTANTYDLFSRPAPEGSAPWWMFKLTGSIPDNFLYG